MASLMLNLGSGTKTSDQCVNIDWSPYLVIKNNTVLRHLVVPFLDRARRDTLRALSNNILLHDLRKPLPFDNASVDVVYHSHVMEHIDRNRVDAFLQEIKRVLRSGGIHRICVPDFEALVRDYVAHVDYCVQQPAAVERHDDYVSALLEQSVRKIAHSLSGKKGLRQFIERVVVGDARTRGETHQWMYDRYNLHYMLESNGFTNVQLRSWNESSIAGWQLLGLETDQQGKEYKARSLYMECRS